MKIASSALPPRNDKKAYFVIHSIDLMSGTELKVLEIIWDWGGEASIDAIARETKISTDYARLICRNLERNNCISFAHSKLCLLLGKGKLEAARRKVNAPKKIAVSEIPKFGLGKNTKGRFILDY